MRVVVDTNVLFQAIYSSDGASFQILSLIRNQKIDVLISLPIILEYEEILTREMNTLGIHHSDVENILTLLIFLGHPISIFFNWRPNLRDEDDNAFVELAVAGNADYLITSNTRDFKRNELKFDGFVVVTPKEFLKKWRST